MKKLLILTLSLTFLLAGCKGGKKDAPAPAADGKVVPAQQVFNQEEMQYLRELALGLISCVKSGEWEEYLKRLDGELEKSGTESPTGQVIANFKIQALSFSGDIDGAKAYVEGLPEGKLKDMMKQVESDLFEPNNIELGKAALLFQSGEFEAGNKVLDPFLQKEGLDTTTKQKALALKAHYYFSMRQAEECEKTLQEAIDLDPESEISQKLTQQLAMYGTILKSSEEEEEKAIEEAISVQEEESIKAPAE